MLPVLIKFAYQSGREDIKAGIEKYKILFNKWLFLIFNISQRSANAEEIKIIFPGLNDKDAPISKPKRDIL